MHREFIAALENTPVIAAAKDMEGLADALRSESAIVFILFGDVMNISDIVRRVKDAEKIAMVHIDLISGLSGKEVSVDYVRHQAQADGILSTRPALIKHARGLDMYTVLRQFLLDSISLENLSHQCSLAHPDCVEILPGVIPKIIRRIREKERTPLIAGGLITEKDDIIQALNAGAISISTTNTALWTV